MLELFGYIYYSFGAACPGFSVSAVLEIEIMCLERGCTCTLRYANGVPLVSPCLKNILFIANFLTWLVGFTMVGVGVYAKTEKQYTGSSSELVLDPATPFIIFGCLIFFITFFGCVGALRENSCMLTFFSYALVFAVVIEVGCAFAAALFTDTFRDKLANLMHHSIIHYRDDVDINNFVDWVQESFQCCGVDGKSDWSMNIYFNCSLENPSRERCGVPYSCCMETGDSDISTVVNTLCGIDMQKALNSSKIIYTEGCLDAFLLWVHDHLFWISFLLVLFGCIPQILGITISRILLIQIKDQDRFIKLGILVDRGEYDFFG